jgi:hypothetical protein
MQFDRTFYHQIAHCYISGIAFEILVGPFTDSKYFVYYFPIDNDNNKKGGRQFQTKCNTRRTNKTLVF